MSKQIIIDWQRDGLFVAMGMRRGSNVTIDTLVTTGGSDAGGQGSSTAISTQLFALAKKLDLNKAEATVIAPREVLEFRTLTIPRADANDVPDMIRFQAQRQMANIGDTWPLDYVLLPDHPGQQGLSALAATISPAHMAEIEATCSDLGITLSRVLARPVEIARWGVAVGNLGSIEISMVIALSRTHVDLLLLNRGSLIQLRNSRLPDDPSITANLLVAEIRRSLLAAAGFMNNESISKVLLIAAPEMAERVEAAIAQATNASVAIIDPASILPSSLPERHEIAQRSASRLASIAGVLSSPTTDRRDSIDLKNCKRREPKKARTREMAIAGTLAGLLLLGGIFFWWSANASLDAAIASAQATALTDKQLTETSKKLIKQRQDVDKFLSGSINWLDEISYVAAKVPPAEEIMLASPTFDLLTDNSGQITVEVYAKDSQAVSRLEQNLSDSQHSVAGSGLKEQNLKKGDYSWTGKEVIRVVNTGWDPLAVNTKSTTAKSTAAKPDDAKAAAAKPAMAAPANASVSNGPDPDGAGPKPADPSASEPKATEPKATEPKATDPKATDPKATDPKATEPNASEPKATEPKATEPKATEPKATEPKASDPKATDPKATEPQKT